MWSKLLHVCHIQMQVCLYSTLLSRDMLQPTEVLCCTENGPSVVPKYVMQVCRSHLISKFSVRQCVPRAVYSLT